MLRETTFKVNGQTLALAPGRERPGLPSWHIVLPEAPDLEEEHISLAFPEGEEAALFDMGGIGYRLFLDHAEAVPFATKGEYWEARDAAGWPFRRRKAKATT